MRLSFFASIFGAMLTLEAAAQTKPVAVPAEIAPGPGDADAIIYYRRTSAVPSTSTSGSVPAPETMILARLTDKGIESKDVLTRNGGLGAPVCAAAGKTYFDRGSNLLCFDWPTGKVTDIGEAYAIVAREGLIYYTSIRYGEHLCVLDAASLTAMNLIAWKADPSISFIRHMVFSPDGKHLAWIAEPNVGRGRSSISGWAIGVFDLAARHNRVLVARLPYTPPTQRSLGSSPDLIAWRDDHTLLTVTNDPPAAGAPTIGNFLTGIDIGTGKMSRLSQMPVTGGGVEFYPWSANNDLAIVQTPASNGGNRPMRLALDPVTSALHEARTSFGKFELDQTDGVILSGKPIDVGLREIDLSPDGNRLLYRRGRGGADLLTSELRCYDATTQADAFVGITSRGLPVGWLFARDLVAPSTPPTPPPGFVPLDQLEPPPPSPAQPPAPTTAPTKGPLRIGIYGG